MSAWTVAKRVAAYGRVPLTVRSTVQQAGTWPWDSCVVDPLFVAPITGSGFTWMQCGTDRFDLKYAGGRYFLHPWGQVKQAINPRLTA